MTKVVNLQVNDSPIPVDYFVESFLDHTVGGMLEALEGTGAIETLELTLDGDQVKATLNGKAVPLNQFVNKIFGSTLKGMVSVLKGVTEVKKIKLNIKR